MSSDTFQCKASFVSDMYPDDYDCEIGGQCKSLDWWSRRRPYRRGEEDASPLIYACGEHMQQLTLQCHRKYGAGHWNHVHGPEPDQESLWGPPTEAEEEAERKAGDVDDSDSDSDMDDSDLQIHLSPLFFFVRPARPHCSESNLGH